MNFGEKTAEYSQRHKKDLPVWQSPKYLGSKAKAEEIISSQKYGLETSDFWILMNTTKTEKMAYTGLIISHNGCLKVNDRLESKFDPSCVSLDKDGYRGSLVYTYCNREQGIYEVGEVNQDNCKNEYPYAMAYKRLFDRVVLKLSKMSYSGIYSDSEAEEFAQRLDGDEDEKVGKPNDSTSAIPPELDIICAECGKKIIPIRHGGAFYTPGRIAAETENSFGEKLCWACAKKRSEAEG